MKNKIGSEVERHGAFYMCRRYQDQNSALKDERGCQKELTEEVKMYANGSTDKSVPGHVIGERKLST